MVLSWVTAGEVLLSESVWMLVLFGCVVGVAAGWRACWRSPSGRNTSLPTVLPDMMLNYHLTNMTHETVN